VPLPAVVPKGDTTEAFNHWANAAAVLQALGRNDAAFEATNKAVAIFPDSAFVHSLRGNLFVEAGSLREAEQEYIRSAALETNGTIWSSLGAIYHRQGRLMEEINAWEQASALLPYPASELLALGYAELATASAEGAAGVRQSGSQPGAEARTTGEPTFPRQPGTWSGDGLAGARPTALNQSGKEGTTMPAAKKRPSWPLEARPYTLLVP